MRYLELKDGWLNLDTKEKIPFGTFAIEAYNTEGDAYREIIKRYGITNPAEELFNNEIWSDCDFEMINVGNLCHTIFEHLFEEECKIHHSKETRQSSFPEMTPEVQNNPTIINNSNIKYEYINNIDLYIADIISKFDLIPTKKYYYNYEWCNFFNVSNSIYNFYDYKCENGIIPKLLFILLDLINTRTMQGKVTFCRNCHKLFVYNNSRQKYCSECSKNYKKNYNQEYNNSTKGLINNAYRYMNNATVFSTAEMADFKNNALNAYETMSEEDFIKWIAEEHSNLKKESKNRKQRLKVGT